MVKKYRVFEIIKWNKQKNKNKVQKIYRMNTPNVKINDFYKNFIVQKFQ